MNHVWSAPLFGRSTCFFLNYCILTWRNIYSAMKHLEK